MEEKSRRGTLAEELTKLREFTCALYRPLTDDQMRFPMRSELNLPLWELGHIAWFQEWWCSRFPHTANLLSIFPNADQLFDSGRIAHETRWTLPLPSPAQIEKYLADTLANTLENLQKVPTAQLYFFDLALRHEAMHVEAGIMAAQLLATPPPFPANGFPHSSAVIEQDLPFTASTVLIGRSPSDRDEFVFDNEKWRYAVELAPFAMRNTLTRNGEYAAFIDDTGYALPAHWRKSATHGMEVRHFDRWSALDADAPLIGVSALDAQAFCDWAKRRLPTEFEWEHAVSQGGIDDAFGIAWQWTASPFMPYPGFAADPYAEYSQPWFDGRHRTLRGSSFVTHSRLSHAKFRNFYLPHRTDVFAGLRTCPLNV